VRVRLGLELTGPANARGIPLEHSNPLPGNAVSSFTFDDIPADLMQSWPLADRMPTASRYLCVGNRAETCFFS
jgi:hypothetical protein